MRKREIRALEKKNILMNFLIKNNLNIPYSGFVLTIGKRNIDNIIYTNEYIKINDFYYLGLVDKSDPTFKSIHTKIYYQCEDCLDFFESDLNKSKNIDCNKYICQKCSCKYTNSRKSKREKALSTLKSTYNTEKGSKLKELYRQQRINYNKNKMPQIIRNYSEVKRNEIKKKKENTFHTRSLEEQKEINIRRTTAFSLHNIENFKKHSEKIKFINEQLNITNNNSDDFHCLIKKYRIIIYNLLTGENWESLKNEAKIFYNNTCQRCGKTTYKSLRLHHTIPFIFVQKNINLLLLCQSCHMIVESKFNKHYNETNNILESKNFSLNDVKNIVYFKQEIQDGNN